MTDVLKNSFRKQTRSVALLIASLVFCNKLDDALAVPRLCLPSSTSSTAQRKPTAAGGSRKRKTRQQPDGEPDLSLTERVDKAALLFVRNNIELLVAEERTKFLNYAATMLGATGETDAGDTCEQRVDYRAKEHGFGRLYPHTVCLQGLSRRLRSTLAAPLYVDIDASNAHPVVLVAIAHENGWRVPCLEHYIANREQVLASTGLPRWIAKQLMLQQTYGGSVRNFLKEKIDSERYLDGTVEQWMRRIPHFVYQYGQEIRSIAANVRGIDPEIYQVAAAKKKGNIAASALSLLVQTRETEAILCAVETIRTRGWEVGVLVHDGFMVYRRDAVERLTVSPGLLSLLRMRVKERCGLDIYFETKDFEPTLRETIAPLATSN